MAKSDNNPHASDSIILSLKGFQLTEDAEGTRLVWLDKDQNEVPMQIATVTLQGIMQELSVSIQGAKQQTTGGEGFVAFNVVEGSVSGDEYNNIIVHFTPASGVRYNFRLDQSTAQMLLDTLGKALDLAKSESPPTQH